MKRRVVLKAALAAFCLPALGGKASAQARWEIGQQIQLPPLELLDGATVDWAALKGKVIVIEFWGSWCPFCARQNPLLDVFYKENRHRGLEVITISLDKTKQSAIDYMKKGGYAFKAGMTTPQWSAIYKQRKGLPQLFVIDRQGRLAMIEVREVMEDDIRDIARFL
jgi:thiol-disulfide isomerase/thioredoxin